jgi:hypothetical protein
MEELEMEGGDGDAALGGQMPGGELQPRLLLRPPQTSFSLLGSGELEGEGGAGEVEEPPFLYSGVGSWREKGAPGRWRKASRHTAAPYLRETGR